MIDPEFNISFSHFSKTYTHTHKKFILLPFNVMIYSSVYTLLWTLWAHITILSYTLKATMPFDWAKNILNH